jgi:S-adenosylmethionine-diacylglycerol 3-amino-3-carboxypropyl transferase
MRSEVAGRADFSAIRYAQCWEDADILVAALEPAPGKRCLSIASAGDNTLALLAGSPDYVLAVDLSPAQLACLELRVSAYRELQHHELLQLIGSVPCDDRVHLYRRCRQRLSPGVLNFWDARSALIERGIGAIGKFEEYFRMFRTWVLPLIHTRARIARLLRDKSKKQRIAFYEKEWNNWRWQALFHIFFSRRLMGALGRSPAFFQYVQGNVATRILDRTRFALTELGPADNPYMQWILSGTHNCVLPFALREENFEPIRRNLDKLEWQCSSVEDALSQNGSFDCFNLSDIFEYMSPESYEQLLRCIVARSNRRARLAYWNMLAPRSRPETMAAVLEPLDKVSHALFVQDKAFFYSAFIVERVR